jgi:hypothetical protein
MSVAEERGSEQETSMQRNARAPHPVPRGALAERSMHAPDIALYLLIALFQGERPMHLNDSS